MRPTKFPTSAATRLFLLIAAAAVAVAAVLSAVLVLDAQRAERAEAERVTQIVARTLAEDPFVRGGITSADPSAVLQPFAESVMAASDLDFVTIMSPDGVRFTHRDPARIGERYIGTIPTSPESLTEERAGTLGPSVRTIAPVTEGDEVVGWVSAGVTLGSIGDGIAARLPFALAVALIVLAAGLVGAVLARGQARRVTGDLAASEIRDTLSSAESMRTLGEALRAQTHEHGNRIHTAVALLEMDRRDEAIALLTDSAHASQQLVDQVTARTDGDATVGALVLGKVSQAAERGVLLRTQIAPDAPRSVLTAVDAVTVVGNLLDNAVDAAAAGPTPRIVDFAMTRSGRDLVLTVRDSGPGVPAELREKVFEMGFSTKPAGAEGRGVGLALVRDIVTAAGGSIRIDDADPSRFEVLLKGRG